MWLIGEECHELIDAIPVLVADDEHDGDIVKTESIEDDIADSARYGFKSMVSPSKKPHEEERKELIDSFDEKIRRIRERRAKNTGDDQPQDETDGS